ncbi:MAG: filamentous hemagglutinin N-terminal domain-containing protein [Acidobacteria bacterium]|nr:filamentous hemagglutinin N-terminal domain-containing protein [Acidobacteriota bacterium]
MGRPVVRGLLFTAFCCGLHAQIIPDGSIGDVPTVSLDAASATYSIGPEAGEIHGPNLFHSFSVFNLSTGQTANFLGPQGIENILARITGSQQSQIDGTIRSDIEGVNLFLINPHGILFQSNARLDIGGSFYAGAADSVSFGKENGQFFADPSRTSTFAETPPEAFGFFDQREGGTIEVSGSRLAVRDSQSLALAGRAIRVSGAGAGLFAPNGSIRLTAQSGSGEVAFSGPPAAASDNPEALVTVDAARIEAPGSGQIYVRAGRFVLEGEAVVSANAQGPRGGGMVDLAAGDSIELDGGLIQSDSAAEAAGGDIHLAAGRIELKGGAQVRVVSCETCRGLGDISVQAGSRLDLSEGARIYGTARGDGDGGRITIDAPGAAVTLTGDVTGIVNDTVRGGSAKAGSIAIDANSLKVADGATVQVVSNSALAADDGYPLDGGLAGGGVTIRVADSIELVGESALILAQTLGSRPGGDVRIEATDLRLAGGSAINLRSGPDVDGVATGSAGNLEIDVARLEMLGKADTEDGPRLPTDPPTLIATSTLGSGDAGDITINAGESVRVEGGLVSPRNFGALCEGAACVDAPDGIQSDTNGSGSAGSIVISTPDMELAGGAVVRAAAGLRTGSSEQSDGASGEITILVDNLTIRGGSRVEGATLGRGAGGTVTISSTGAVRIEGVGRTRAGETIASGVYSDSLGDGAAGRVVLRADSLTISDAGAIRADTVGRGDGGAITIEAGDATLLDGAQITTSTAGRGQAGSVQLTATGTVRISGAEGLALSSPDGSRLSSKSEGKEPDSGAAGSIVVHASRIQVLDGGGVSVEADAGQAGSISLIADDLLLIREGTVIAGSNGGLGGQITFRVGSLAHLVDSVVATNVRNGAGNAGDISMFGDGAPAFAVLERTSVVTSAIEGDGGDITLEARTAFLVSPRSILDASSRLSTPGVIDIRSPVAELSGFINPLSDYFLRSTDLLSDPCGPGSSRRLASSYTQVGLPSPPPGQRGGRSTAPSNNGSCPQ